MFSGSSVAIVTPMKPTPQGSVAIDWNAFEALLAWHAQAGTQSVVVAGTTGESATLDHDDYVALITQAVTQLKGRVGVIAGTGSPSTEATVAKTRLAQDLGVDACLVVTPAYNRPSQRGLIAHYEQVADVAEVDVILYNVPTRTAVDLLPETALTLAAHPKIVAIKEAVPDMDRIQKLRAGGLAVLSGDDGTFLEAMRHGACGVISVAANVAPTALAQITGCALAGEWDQAQATNTELTDLYDFLGVETNPVPVKWLLAQMGRCHSALRLPLVELDSRYHEQGNQLMDRLKAQLC